MRPQTTSNVPRAVLAVAWLGLSACGPHAATNGAAGAPVAAAPSGGPDRVIDVSDMPRPKGGLWRQTVDDGDGKPATSAICLSGKAPVIAKLPKDCSRFTIKRTFLGAIVVDISCGTPELSMAMHSVGTGDYQSNMSSDMTMTMTMKGQPARTTKTHTEAHYVGPCAPGQTPDDRSGDATSASG